MRTVAGILCVTSAIDAVIVILSIVFISGMPNWQRALWVFALINYIVFSAFCGAIYLQWDAQALIAGVMLSDIATTLMIAYWTFRVWNANRRLR